MTTNITWQSRAPGSLMLFGEHAVLHGKPAIACAMNTWLTIDWQQRSDHELHIDTHLGQHQTDWHTLASHPKLSFVMTALSALKATYPTACQQGLNIRIHSEINSTQGLGSSSAVVAALVTGLAQLVPNLNPIDTRFTFGHQIIRHVQGTGSGTDLAAALSGGVMLFDAQQRIHHLANALPIVSLYCGYKTPTPQVIAFVKQRWPQDHPLFQQWLACTSDITQRAAQAIQRQQLDELGRCMNMAHGLMHGLGVSDTKLDQLVHQLRATKGILGAKISGSGLGDCVIGLGHPAQLIPEALSIQTTAQGAYCTEDTPAP